MRQKNWQTQQDEKVQNDLEEFLKAMIKIDDYHEILDFIFELYFKKSDNENPIPELRNHILSLFQVDPKKLFNYMQYNKKIKINEISLNRGKYKTALNCVNEVPPLN